MHIRKKILLQEVKKYCKRNDFVEVKSLNSFVDTENICNFAARNGVLCAVETKKK